MLSDQTKQNHKGAIFMNIITSNAHFRQRVLKYSFKYGVTKASKSYKVSRNAIYEWRAKYDGKSWKSLVDRSHRPHHHPNEHTAEEKAMILRRYPRYKDGMIQLWNSFREIFRCDVGQIGVVSIITLTTP